MTQSDRTYRKTTDKEANAMASNDIEVLGPAATIEKIKKIASGVALNRRHFMAALGAAGVAAGTGLVSGPVARAQQPTPTGYAQTDVLNFLLNIKYLKGTFYSFVTQGVDLPGPSYITLSSSQVYNQPGQVSFSALPNSSQITDLFNEMYFDDLNHLIDLRNLIESASGTTGAAAAAVVAPRPTLNLLGTSAANASFSAPATTTFISGAQAIAMARMFEDLSVTAFAGALQYLSGANLATAAAIMAVDGCHAAALRLTTIQSGAPYQGTFYVGPTFQIAPVLGSTAIFMPSTGTTTTNGIVHPAVGDAINGFGIPIGATVTSVANIGLSNIVPSCYATAGSPILTVIGALPSSSPSPSLVGMTITGTNIPAFTYVTAANSATPLSTITMSQAATASSVETPTGIFTAGAGFNGGNAPNNPNLITAVSSVTGLVAARGISASGYLTPNTNAPGTPPNAVFIATTAFTSSTATQAVGTITVLMNASCLKSSTLTLSGSITAGTSTITNITWGPNSSGATSTIAQVIPTTQPVIVGSSAAPVDPVSIAATVTNGSASVTGIASTAALTVGQPVYSPAIPSGTTIKTINSLTAITLSSAATAAGTYILTATVLPPNTLITGTNTTTNTITLNANALSSYTGTFTIPWAVPINFVSVTTETVAIGRANISISEPATATGTGTATIVSPSGDPYEVAPVDPGTAALSAGGPAPLAFVTSGTLTNTPPSVNRGFFATAGVLNASATNPAGLAFARTFSQVLSVLYGSTTPGTYDGGFFPAAQSNGDSTNTFGGVSGTITIV